MERVVGEHDGGSKMDGRHANDDDVDGELVSVAGRNVAGGGVHDVVCKEDRRESGRDDGSDCGGGERGGGGSGG